MVAEDFAAPHGGAGDEISLDWLVAGQQSWTTIFSHIFSQIATTVTVTIKSHATHHTSQLAPPTERTDRCRIWLTSTQVFGQKDMTKICKSRKIFHGFLHD